MKRILTLCALALMVVSCADKGPVAPKEGRQSIGTVLDQPMTTKDAIKTDKAQVVQNWVFVNKTATNKRPVAKISGPMNLVRTVSVGKGINDDYQTLAGPVVSGDKIYTLDSHFVLQATDLKAGKELWRKPLGEVKGAAAKSIGLAIYHNKLYVVAGNGLVMALDLSGNPVWTRELKVPLRSVPVADEKRLFVSSIHNELFALNTDTGKVLWQYTGERAVTNFFGMGTPAVSGSVVVMPTTSGRVNAFNVVTGMMLWTEDMWTNKTYNPILDIPHVTAAPVIENGRVYLVGNAGKTGAYQLHSGQALFTTGVGGRETPILDGNALFLVNNQKELMALSKNQGKVFWQTKLTAAKDRDNQAVWYGPIGVNNELIVVSNLGDIVFYDMKNGAEKRREKQKEFVGAPVVAGNTLLLLATDGSLLFYQ